MPDCHLDWAGGGRRQSTLLSQSEPRQLRRAVNSSSTSIHATKPEKSIRTHFSERVDPEKTHVPVDLSRKEDGMADTSLAGNRGRINKTDGRRRRIRHREPHLQHISARRTPPSIMTGIAAPTASAIAGSTRMGETTPSSCRPPWVGNDNAINATVTGDAGVLPGHNALDDQGPFHHFRISSRGCPVQVILCPKIPHHAPGQDRRAACRVGVLEVGHAVRTVDSRPVCPLNQKPYSLAGLSTRMRFRTISSGAQSDSRSNRTASSGLASAFEVGCGQSVPHTSRSGASFT